MPYSRIAVSTPAVPELIRDEGTDLPRRTIIDFVGDGVQVTDAGGRTVVTIPAPTSSLAISSAASTTSVTVVNVPSGLLAGGSYIAIGVTTSKCEIRRVTSIAGSVLGIELALNYDHAAGENVAVLASTWVPPEWFGCIPDSSVDSFAGLQQAFNDMAGGAKFGLTGHSNRYYTTTPLCVYDNSLIEDIAITVKTPFAIDPLVGTRESEPDQYMMMLAGQFGTVTSVDTTANTLTLSGQAGAQVGDRLVFYPRQGATLPAPLEAGRGYYMKTFPGGNVYTISVDRGGAELDITTAGTGTTMFYSSGLSRMKWRRLTLEGNSLRGLNGLAAQVQQPSAAHALRIDGFPGPKGCAVIGGQQGDFYTPMFVHGQVGLTIGSGQFIYLYGGNFEACDTCCILDDVTLEGAAAGNGDIQFFGGHWEQPGNYTHAIQTIMGNALVSAGTYTLTFSSQVTGAIAFDASAATIQTALETLSNIDPGDVVCTDEAGGLPGGRVRLTFAGQYTNSVVPSVTVQSTGLTGGSYSMNLISPNAQTVSVQTGSGVWFHGGRVSASSKPDGSGTDFITIESAATTTAGVSALGVTSTGQGGYAINDIPRGITVPWADSSGAAERLQLYSAGGYHGGTVAKNWWLAGRLGGHLVWDEYAQTFQVNSGAALKLGGGTSLKAMTTGATSVADGGTVTHGLGATPDVVTANPSVSGEFISVTAKDGTTFTVAIKKHDGTAGTTQTIYWQALDT